MFFGPWAYPILMKKTENPQYLHVKHENTRKNTIKMDENTLFSQIDKILKIYPRLDEYISFPFVPGSRTGFKRLCGHILVSSKGDRTYYISFSKLFSVVIFWTVNLITYYINCTLTNRVTVFRLYNVIQIDHVPLNERK